MPERPFSRTDRITALLHELAAEFIRAESNTTPLITVTRADISPDLTKSTIFVSVFPETQEEDALIFLKRKGGAFRDYVKQHAKLKRIPHFSFSLDYGEKNRQQLDALSG